MKHHRIQHSERILFTVAQSKNFRGAAAPGSIMWEIILCSNARRTLLKNVVIYHNPACGTSRNTLTMIRNAGIEPEVIEYLHNPPTRARLLELIAASGLTVRQVVREKVPRVESQLKSRSATVELQWTAASRSCQKGNRESWARFSTCI